MEIEPSASFAIYWTEKIISCAVILQSLELIGLRSIFSDNGVWQWRILKDDFVSLPGILKRLFDLLLSCPTFVGLVWLRLACAFTLLVFSPVPYEAGLLFIVFVTTWLISIRWRGTFNGGSDYMTVVVLLSLFVAKGFPQSDFAARAALYYIALQSAASYFIAGFVKLRNAKWRNGAAIVRYLKAPAYFAPAGIQHFFRKPGSAKAVSWAIILFECVFPFGVFHLYGAITFACAAACFHLLNVYLFGLNRFFFAWLATYPAYLWAAGV